MVVMEPTQKDNLTKLGEIGKEKKYIEILKKEGRWYEHHKLFKKIV